MTTNISYSQTQLKVPILTHCKYLHIYQMQISHYVDTSQKCGPIILSCDAVMVWWWGGLGSMFNFYDHPSSHPPPSPGPSPDHQLFGRRRVILIIDQVLCNFGVRRWIIFNQFPLYRAEIIRCWAVPVFSVLVVMTNVAPAAARHLYSWLSPALGDTGDMTGDSTQIQSSKRIGWITFQKLFSFNTIKATLNCISCLEDL